MSETIEETTQEKIERLKQQLADTRAKIPEPPIVEEVPKEDPPETSPEEIKAIKDELKENGLKNAKVIKPQVENYVPPDPTAHLTGMAIKWIDHRYQIHGVPGIPGGNIITVRSIDDIHQLIDNLVDTVKNFDQPKMISTK